MVQWKKHLIGEWNWKRPFKSMAFIYLSLLLIVSGCSDQLIHHPPVTRYSADSPNIQTIAMPSGKKIAICHLPASAGMPTLLWSHGNGEDIGYLQARFAAFHRKGYGIFAYDYPGYGISEGTPTEQGCYDAVQTCWNHLSHELGIGPDQIIIYGQSVGSGPACWLAAKHPCNMLMLVTPFTSAFRTVTRIPIFPGDQFKNIKLIGSITAPLLVVHGDQDQVVKQWHGKKLHELHVGPKHFLDVSGAGHNDIFGVAGPEIIRALDQFRAKHTQKNQPSSTRN